MSTPTLPSQPQTFRAAGWLAPFLTLGGLLFIGLTVLSLLLPILDPDDPVSRGLPRFVFAVIFGVFAGQSLYSARHVWRYRFTLGPLGFSEAPRHDSRQVVPWSRLVGVYPRPVMQRLDLRGPGGELLAALEYHVQDLQRAFEQVLERVPHRPVRLPCVFQRQVSWSARLLVALLVGPLLALGVWVWLRNGQVGGLFFLLFFVAIIALESLTTLSRTIVAADGVVLVTGLKHKRVPWGEVAKVELAARPGQHGARRMDVALHLRDGRTRFLLPAGADLLALNTAAQSAHREYANAAVHESLRR